MIATLHRNLWRATYSGGPYLQLVGGEAARRRQPPNRFKAGPSARIPRAIFNRPWYYAAAVIAPLALAASTAQVSGAQVSAAQVSGAQPSCSTYRPAEAMTTSLGSKSALGYFVNKDGACHVALLVSEKFDPEPEATPADLALFGRASKLGIAAPCDLSLDRQRASIERAIANRDRDHERYVKSLFR